MTTSPGRSPYKKAFLESQRARLERERARLQNDIDMHIEEMRNWSDHDDAGIDQHMADDATALSEQELDVTKIDNARYIMREIDDALERLDGGRYGWDEDAEVWIREERLQALPWARREIPGQQRAGAGSSGGDGSRGGRAG